MKLGSSGESELVKKLLEDTEFNYFLNLTKKDAGYYDKDNNIHTTMKFCEYYYNLYKDYDAVMFHNTPPLAYYFFDSNHVRHPNNKPNSTFEFVFRHGIFKDNINVYNYEFIESIYPFLECISSFCDTPKKILLINPFKESLEKQIPNLNKIIKNYEFPQIDFLIYTTPLTFNNKNNIYGTLPHNNWFETVNHMCNEISKLDFDIALISCASYSLPLGSFIKNMGKKAIYLGGILQMYFGILGSRWNNSQYQNIFNFDQMISPIEYQHLSQYKENYSNGEGLKAYL